jgi:hypothetical protein
MNSGWKVCLIGFVRTLRTCPTTSTFPSDGCESGSGEEAEGDSDDLDLDLLPT